MLSRCVGSIAKYLAILESAMVAKRIKRFSIVLFAIFMLLAWSSSADGATAPTVTTTAISGTTTTSANSGGNVTLDGGAAVTARGVCWATHPCVWEGVSHHRNCNIKKQKRRNTSRCAALIVVIFQCVSTSRGGGFNALADDALAEPS